MQPAEPRENLLDCKVQTQKGAGGKRDEETAELGSGTGV